jgi:murein DD-endopeptidase MepM/ murein hydrolase activator NlpD
MSFTQLQRETAAQQTQLRDSLDQARNLEDEIITLRQQMADLMKALNLQGPTQVLPPMPDKGDKSDKPIDGKRMSELRRELENTSAQAKLIRTKMDPIIYRWNHTPSVPPTAGYLSSGFGLRINPFTRFNEVGENLLTSHSGFDITNAEGTPIQATADGVVEEAGWLDRYGNAVVIRHSTELKTLYAHMSRLDVKAGQTVSRGDILGAMGRTGNATGVHLHYEVRRNDRPVNPQPYMRLQREWLSTFK